MLNWVCNLWGAPGASILRILRGQKALEARVPRSLRELQPLGRHGAAAKPLAAPVFGFELRRGGVQKGPGARILRIFRVQKAFGPRIKRIPQGLQLLNPGGQSPAYFTSLEGPRGQNPTYSTRVAASGEVEDRGGGKARPQGLGFYS